MAELVWSEAGTRIYETGVDRGVLYPYGDPGVAWNGLIAIDEAPVGGDVESLWYDGDKFLDVVGNEDFAASLEAFHAPREFAKCDGVLELAPGITVGQQRRFPFDLCYRTLIGNDLQGLDYGYKLHLVYGCKAATASKKYSTRTQTPEPLTRTWNISTVPEMGVPYKPTAHLIIDSTRVPEDFLTVMENILYGRLAEPAVARMPTQAEILDLIGEVTA